MLLIKIVNDGTGDVHTGHYDYQVFVNREIIARGRIENHDRLAGGWRGLVRLLADKVNKVGIVK